MSLSYIYQDRYFSAWKYGILCISSIWVKMFSQAKCNLYISGKKANGDISARSMVISALPKNFSFWNRWFFFFFCKTWTSVSVHECSSEACVCVCFCMGGWWSLVHHKQKMNARGNETCSKQEESGGVQRRGNLNETLAQCPCPGWKREKGGYWQLRIVGTLIWNDIERMNMVKIAGVLLPVFLTGRRLGAWGIGGCNSGVVGLLNEGLQSYQTMAGKLTYGNGGWSKDMTQECGEECIPETSTTSNYQDDYVVVQLTNWVWFCDCMDCGMPGFPILHHLSEFAQTHVQWVGAAMQPSHTLWSPSPPTFSLSQHHGHFQWASRLHQMPKGWRFI